jgi:hypothetical protein
MLSSEASSFTQLRGIDNALGRAPVHETPVSFCPRSNGGSKTLTVATSVGEKNAPAVTETLITNPLTHHTRVRPVLLVAYQRAGNGTDLQSTGKRLRCQ